MKRWQCPQCAAEWFTNAKILAQECDGLWTATHESTPVVEVQVYYR